MALQRKYTDEELRTAVPKSFSVAQVLKTIGLRPAGGNYKTVRSRILELGLDTSHFLGQGWLKGKSITLAPVRPLSEVLVEGSSAKSHDLKLRLLREGLKHHICEGCEGTTWRGKPIPLELEHVNGRSTDNRLENLALLCPNCHAQTSTYRGRNIGRNPSAPVFQR
jgi:hypothetical protein